MLTLTLSPEDIETLVALLGGAEPMYRDLGESEIMPGVFKRWTVEYADACKRLSEEIVRQHNEQVS